MLQKKTKYIYHRELLHRPSEISKKLNDPIVNAIKTFENHPRILKIIELNTSCKFSFENISFFGFQKDNSRAGYIESSTTSRYSNQDH